MYATDSTDRVLVPVSTLRILDASLSLASTGTPLTFIARRADATDRLLLTNPNASVAAATYRADVAALLRANAVLSGALTGLLSAIKASGVDLTDTTLSPDQRATLDTMRADFLAGR